MRVLIVDDHEVVRRGVRSLLSSKLGVQVCGEAVDGRSAVAKAAELKPDVITMDVSMPNLNGLEATREIRRILPQVQILILSQHDVPEMMQQALNAGASGYVVKSAISTDLIAALEKIQRGEHAFDASMSGGSELHIDTHEILQRSAAFEKALRSSEEELHQSRDYHLAVMNNMAEGLYTVDTHGLATSINPAALAMLGWTQQELLGKNMHAMIHYQHPDGTPFPAGECAGLGVLQSGVEIREHEDVFIRKDGSFVPVVFSAAPLRVKGEISGVVVGFRDDTEQRRIREALQSSEEHFRAIVETTPECVKLVARDGTLVHMNSSGLAMVGADSPARVVGKNIYDLVAPQDREKFRAFNERICGGERGSLEFDIVGLQGGLRHMETHAAPLRTPDGTVVQLAVARDITRRKRADLEQNRLAAIVESSDDAIISKDLNGVITSWNRSAQRIFGFTAEEAIGQPITIIIPDELQDEEKQIIGRLRSGERIEHYETVRMAKSGKKLNVSLTISPLKDSQGKIVGASKVARDITEKRIAEEARRKSEEHLELALQASKAGFFQWDAETARSTWNPQMAAIYGYPLADGSISGEEWLALIHPLDRDAVRQRALEAHSNSSDYQHEFRIVRPDGEVRWIHSQGSVLRDKDNKCRGVVGIHLDITERKRFEEALRNSQAQLDLALESSNTAMFEWDIAKSRGKWNSQMTAIYGFTPENGEITAEQWRQLFHPEDTARLLKEAEQVFRSGDHFEFEFRALKPDGSLRWVLSKGRVIRDSQGNPQQMIGTHADITSRKQTEQALSRSEQQFRVLADSIPALCWMAHPDGHIFWYNQGWYEYTGVSEGQSEGWNWQSLHDPKVLPDVLQKWRASIATGQPFEMVFPLRSAAGDFHSFLTRVRPLKDEAGKVLRWFGTNTDITSQKRTEDALREREERLRAAFSQTYSFLVLLNLDGTIIDANRAAALAAGCDREDLIGRPFWEPWWTPLPEEIAILKTAISKAAGGETTRSECYFCLPDGTRRFADRTLGPVRDENGKVLMIVATGLDMTEQKDLRDQLEARVQERTLELVDKNTELLEQTHIIRELSGRLLQSQDEERRRIARELHDGVGQLLAAVGMNIATVSMEKEKLSATAARCVEENSKLVQQVSTEIRTLSHLLHPPLLDEVGLQSALRWFVDGFAERSKIRVTLELPPKLERLPEDYELALFRVVQEGLTNIHRHSGSATAVVRLACSDSEVKLEVRDSGKGLDPNNKAQLIAGEGSGVGLRGMRERVRQIGGTLDIRSGQTGTSLIVALPAFTPPQVQTARSQSNTPDGAGAASGESA